MPKEKRGPGRPADRTKSVVWCRIGNDLIAALDEMAVNMRPVPTRAALINLAIEEYVQRNRKDKRAAP